MFEKFDSAGDDLFNIIQNELHKRALILQIRFINVCFV